MYTDYDELPDNSKVWVYTADSKLSDDEVFVLQKQIQLFCDQWLAHKEPVKAWGGVMHNLFLVLVADEAFNAVGGCSIDSSTQFIHNMGSSIGVDFLDRKNVAFFSNDHWSVHPQSTVIEALKNGEILPEDRVFNFNLTDKADFEQHFSIPVADSWLKRYIPQEA